jgi:hypothetical protein
MKEYYTIQIKDICADIIFTQSIKAEYKDAALHAEKLCNFFAFDSFYEINEDN